jgi:hypothetical protein
MNNSISEKFQELSEHILPHVKTAAKDQVIEVLNEASIEALAESAAQKDAMVRITESMSKIKVQFGLLGIAMGATAGGMAAFAIAYRKAETKYSKIADEEIEEMREHYQAKSLALEADKGKGDLEEIVKERGYSSPESQSVPQPMAIQPPLKVVEEAAEAVEGSVDLDAPENASIKAQVGEPEPRNIFQQAETTHEWDWEAERRSRRPNKPYVVHADERHEIEEYHDVSLTYYEVDDVLCDDRDEIVDPADRDELIGEANLERFGHGSGDASVVYIRNDKLEILYEVIKSPNSFAEEVHGIKHESYDRGNLRRMRMREMDDE